LYALGIDSLLIREFDQAFASIEANGFLAHLKDELPGLKAIYIGEYFRFGKGRKGDVALLIQQGKAMGVDTFSVPQLHHNGETISSTRIRAALAAGELLLANNLLGRTYTPEGTVVEGAKRGRTIGFPTLNIPWEAQLRPKYGVYAVKVRIQGTNGGWQPAVANFGIRPTVGDIQEPLLEVHVLEETTLSYGDRLEVAFHSFLRPEAKFPSFDALKAAIVHDAARAKSFL
jgi:riboflavin kinase/FMN adenylyltransferase